MTKPDASPIWMELTIDSSGGEIRISARGSRGERIERRALGGEHDAPSLLKFAASVERAAERGKALTPDLLADARALQKAMFDGEIGGLYERLRGAAGGPVLLRLVVDDRELRGVPWEALCKPGEALGFWASSSELHVVRGVMSSEAWRPSEVRGALRVLAVAPIGSTGAHVAALKSALFAQIEAGTIEWLDPLEGQAAHVGGLFERLRSGPVPHVLHFLGHGGLVNGMPAVRLADDEDGDEKWLPVELLGQQLKAGFGGGLRLIVLEACAGAQSSAFASAAEILARDGADAVIAHLWSVKAHVARAASAELYRALVGGDRSGGDIALSINEARRAILAEFDASAEAFSPVLYLRRPDGVIFDFVGREGAALPASAPNNLKARNPYFRGRGDELAALEAALREATRTTITHASVYGLGGVGKTALALEYSHRALDRGDFPGGIWWVHAEGHPMNALANLAPVLRSFGPPEVQKHIPEDEVRLEKVAEAVRLSLQGSPRKSLVVLDNVSEPGWGPYLPGGEVRILVTTRDETLALGKAQPLPVLPKAQARELAEVIAGVVRGEVEEGALDRVLQGELGGLAVAVQMAARAVKSRRCNGSWVVYEKMLRAEMDLWLTDSRLVSDDYGRGVFAALDLSIDQCDEGARSLLEGVAIFGPEGVPLEWAVKASGLESEGSQARALGMLGELGLVTQDDTKKEVSLHRLVHRRVRKQAETEHGDMWREASGRGASAAATWIEGAVRLNPTRLEMEAVEARREHVDEALDAANRANEPVAWIRLANGLARHLRHRGQYAESRSLFEKALAKAEQLDPADPSRVASVLSNLALVLRALGDATGAKLLLERSLVLAETTFGREHSEVAIHLSNLALVLQDLGDAARARPLMERALAIDETTFGRERSTVAIRLSNLAMVLKDLGDAARARPLLERSLAIVETMFGPEHPDVAIRLSNLATVLHDLGDAAGARPLLERALAIDEMTFGRDHPTVAIRLSNLATVLKDLGDAAGARPLLERTLAIFEARLPPNHPYLARARRNLAALGVPPFKARS